MRRLLAGLAISILVSGAHAGGVDRLKHFLDSTRTFRASFTQTIHFKSGKKPQQSSGIIALSRPGKFRWQVEKPYQQLIVGDGAKVWLFDPDLKQVTVRKMVETLGGTPAAILAGEVGQGSGSIEKSFTLTDAGEAEGREWVEARPKAADATFERLRLGFRGDVLQAMEMHDNFGQATAIEFAAVERNPDLPASLFRFVPPPGVDVVGD